MREAGQMSGRGAGLTEWSEVAAVVWHHAEGRSGLRAGDDYCQCAAGVDRHRSDQQKSHDRSSLVKLLNPKRHH